jgi:hypothetical protein
MKNSKKKMHGNPETAPQRLAESNSVASTGQHKARCSAMTKKGEPCPQWSIRGQKFCPMHVPGNAAKFGRRGGMRRAIYNPAELSHFVRPQTVEDVVSILGQITVEVHKGQLDPRVGQVLGSLAGTFLSALELKEFGAKLRELEKRLGVNSDPLDRDLATGRFQ